MGNDKPSSLIKFCTAPTAESILSTKTLRWSAPYLFGDPFELDQNLSLEFDKPAVLEATIKLCSAMIFAREQPKGETPLITAIRRWRDEERFSSPEEAETVLKELLTQMVDQRFELLNKTLSAWRQYNKTIRICCFSAKPENVTCWQRFAENHRGIAIRFESNEYVSTKNPIPIEYNKERPELTTLRNQISGLLYNTPDSSKDKFQSLFQIKSILNKSEQEWRCFRSSTNSELSDEPDDWFDDIKFERSEISAIYFGLQTSEEVKTRVLSIVKQDFSAAKLFQTQLGKNKYEIEMVKI